MTYFDFSMVFVVNYGIGVGLWSAFRRKLIWYDPLFIVLVQMCSKTIISHFIPNTPWGDILSIILTIYLYSKVFLPITYPIKRVTHESINNNDQ